MELENVIAEEVEKLNQQEIPTEVEETSEAEDIVEAEGDDDDDLDEAGLKEATHLYKLLKNPDTRNLVLKTLGERAGLFDKPVETPKEIAKAKRDIKEILSDKLGKEFDFLIPKLGDALNEILEQSQETQQATLTEIQQTQINTQVVNELDKLASETKGASRGLEKRMSALATKFPAGQGVTVKEYVRGLYSMALGEKPPTDATKVVDRIRRNSKDVPSRLTSTTGALKDSPKNMGKMSIDQSVKHSLKQLGMSD